MAEIFWDTLGIAPTTDTKKIRKAYSDLVKVHNPEDDEETFRKINQAYRAAMNFARQLSALNVSDDNIVVTDRREDGTFGISIKREGGWPDSIPVLGPALELDEKKEEQEPLYNFGSIDSTVVRDLSYKEIDDMTGYLTLAPGFRIPDGDKARKIKAFIDNNDLIKTMSAGVDPASPGKAMKDALYTAELILNDEVLRGERIMWNFYFNSPQVLSLYTNFEFYSELENLIDLFKVTSAEAHAIADNSHLHPRVYVIVNKPDKSVAKVDFLTNVAFKYKTGKYPVFDELMKNEKPEDVKELTDFLEHLRFNLYAMLMPRIHPIKKDAYLDAVSAFNYILKSPECEKMRDKPVLWKLYFQGALIKTMISDHDLHIGLTRSMLEMNLRKPLVKTIKKAIGGEVCFIRSKAGSKEYFYITFMDSDIQKDKNNKEIYVPYGQMTPWVQIVVTIVMLLFCISIAVIVILMWYGKI